MTKEKEDKNNGNIEQFIKLQEELIEEAYKENKEKENKGDK